MQKQILHLLALLFIIYFLKADETVVSKGLEDTPEERTALRYKPGTVSRLVEELISSLII